MTDERSEDQPSAEEVRRRIEVGLANAGIADATDASIAAAAAIQPLIDVLKAHRDAAREGTRFREAIAAIARSAPPTDLRRTLLAALRDLEPWNGEWVTLGNEDA